MNIQGLQKLTLLDFPGKVACTVFTGGCNFRCPFCHNASLVIDYNKNEAYTIDEIVSFLKKRKNVLDGVCITGGEPLMQNDIESFIKQIKDIGYLVKLDTNGSYPEKLKNLIDQGLVDYVAMDIKNSPESYAKTIGVENYDLSKVMKSYDILIQNKVAYEFRTTIVKELHTKADMQSIGKWLKGVAAYYLQAFVDSGDLINIGLHGLSKEEMIEMKNIVKEYVANVEVRGI